MDNTTRIGYPVRPCAGCVAVREEDEQCISIKGCSTFQSWRENTKKYVAQMNEQTEPIHPVYYKVYHCYLGKPYHVDESVLITASAFDAQYALREMQNTIVDKQTACPVEYEIRVIRQPDVMFVEEMSPDMQWEVEQALKEGRFWCGLDDNYYEVDGE